MTNFEDLGFQPINQSVQKEDHFSSLGFQEIQQPKASVSSNTETTEAPSPKYSVEESKDPSDVIPATARGLVRGVGDAALEYGNLAGDILSKFNMTKKAGDYIKEKTSSNIEPSEIEKQFPAASSIGAGLGYTGAQIAVPGGIVKGVSKATGLGKLAAEYLHPVISSAGREATIGALQGASMQPDNREFGATVGGTLGGLTGAIGGAISKGVTGAASEINPELDKMQSLGIDPRSPEAFARARQELASRGEGSLKNNIEQQIMNKAQSEIDSMKPNSVNIPDKSPNQILVEKQSQNFADVSNRKIEAYRPLQESTGTIETNPILDNNETMLKSTRSSYLPSPELSKPIESGNSDFSSLQAYRQELDNNIRAAKRANIPPKELNKLYETRNIVSKSMSDVAESQGLGDKFTEAERIYKQEYLPFRTFTKDGKLATPEQSDEAWHKINSLLNSKNPNPKELKDMISTLGDEGKDLVGWALLQNAFNGAKAGEMVSLSSFNNAINKYRVSGLDSLISKPEYKNAVVGINRVISEGKKAMNVKTNRLYIPIVSPVIEHLMQTETGMKLIIKLGSENPNSKTYRDSIQSLFTGAANIPVQKIMQTPKENIQNGY